MEEFGDAVADTADRAKKSAEAPVFSEADAATSTTVADDIGRGRAEASSRPVPKPRSGTTLSSVASKFWRAAVQNRPLPPFDLLRPMGSDMVGEGAAAQNVLSTPGSSYYVSERVPDEVDTPGFLSEAEGTSRGGSFAVQAASYGSYGSGGGSSHLGTTTRTTQRTDDCPEPRRSQSAFENSPPMFYGERSAAGGSCAEEYAPVAPAGVFSAEPTVDGAAPTTTTGEAPTSSSRSAAPSVRNASVQNLPNENLEAAAVISSAATQIDIEPSSFSPPRARGNEQWQDAIFEPLKPAEIERCSVHAEDHTAGGIIRQSVLVPARVEQKPSRIHQQRAANLKAAANWSATATGSRSMVAQGSGPPTAHMRPASSTPGTRTRPARATQKHLFLRAESGLRSHNIRSRPASASSTPVVQSRGTNFALPPRKTVFPPQGLNKRSSDSSAMTYEQPSRNTSGLDLVTGTPSSCRTLVPPQLLLRGDAKDGTHDKASWIEETESPSGTTTAQLAAVREGPSSASSGPSSTSAAAVPTWPSSASSTSTSTETTRTSGNSNSASSMFNMTECRKQLQDMTGDFVIPVDLMRALLDEMEALHGENDSLRLDAAGLRAKIAESDRVVLSLQRASKANDGHELREQQLREELATSLRELHEANARNAKARKTIFELRKEGASRNEELAEVKDALHRAKAEIAAHQPIPTVKRAKKHHATQTAGVLGTPGAVEKAETAARAELQKAGNEIKRLRAKLAVQKLAPPEEMRIGEAGEQGEKGSQQFGLAIAKARENIEIGKLKGDLEAQKNEITTLRRRNFRLEQRARQLANSFGAGAVAGSCSTGGKSMSHTAPPGPEGTMARGKLNASSTGSLILGGGGRACAGGSSASSSYLESRFGSPGLSLYGAAGEESSRLLDAPTVELGGGRSAQSQHLSLGSPLGCTPASIPEVLHPGSSSAPAPSSKCADTGTSSRSRRKKPAAAANSTSKNSQCPNDSDEDVLGKLESWSRSRDDEWRTEPIGFGASPHDTFAEPVVLAMQRV
eukprot:CAMPEP_0178992540 /NCGR_PEP_ID=MMETSP0795-20121207/6173_1 /TAXON_ID=88552 /ORGANISM="Amoebophrya sp., Strain Ameob2" /LENGTH=1026 /DNA_ID=CAMNT_0020684437 /DNA_START=146 /DNA_END=3223 /DNA_ORIENTATION=+